MTLKIEGGWYIGGGISILKEPAPSLYKLWSWGTPFAGELGQGNTNAISSPTQVGALTTWLSVAAAYDSSFAISTENTLWAWGSNQYGKLGLTGGPDRSSPVQVGNLYDWLSVAGGPYATVAIKTDGTLWTWGYNLVFGLLGLGDKINRSSPVQVGVLTNWTSVSSTSAFCLKGTVTTSIRAVKTDGTMWAWGNNSYGQLGLNDTASRSSPVQVTGGGGTWIAPGTGVCSIDNSGAFGRLYAWGCNNTGQLGLSTTISRSAPVQIGIYAWQCYATNGWEEAYATSSMAIRSNGTLWAWGSNEFGELGLGDKINRSSPTQVGALTNWAVLTMGGIPYPPGSGASTLGTTSGATKTNGQFWTWGSNAYGQLGLGDTLNRSSSVQVGTLTTWARASAGKTDFLAVKT